MNRQDFREAAFVARAVDDVVVRNGIGETRRNGLKTELFAQVNNTDVVAV